MRSHIHALVTMSCLPSPVKSQELCETADPVAAPVAPVHVSTSAAGAAVAEPTSPTASAAVAKRTEAADAATRLGHVNA